LEADGEDGVCLEGIFELLLAASEADVKKAGAAAAVHDKVAEGLVKKGDAKGAAAELLAVLEPHLAKARAARSARPLGSGLSPPSAAALSSAKHMAIIHFAALKAVGESISKPLDYYENNLGGLTSVLAAARAYSIKQIVFSSSATVSLCLSSSGTLSRSSSSTRAPLPPSSWTAALAQGAAAPAPQPLSAAASL
jgi:nucleoside-diphosphate-sugar epimerase